ncbi:MAG: hypothetical protein IKC89_02910 [Lentisphaeria bacterium]|nr:hypothetical protein [Lentisphaeria bacterium]
MNSSFLKRFFISSSILTVILLSAAPLEYIPRNATGRGQIDFAKFVKLPIFEDPVSKINAALKELGLSADDLHGKIAFGITAFPGEAKARFDFVAEFAQPIAKQFFDEVYKSDSKSPLKKIKVGNATGYQAKDYRVLLYGKHLLVFQGLLDANLPYADLKPSPLNARDKALITNTAFAEANLAALMPVLARNEHITPQLITFAENIHRATLVVNPTRDNGVKFDLTFSHITPEACQASQLLVTMTLDMLKSNSPQAIPDPVITINGNDLKVSVIFPASFLKK